MKAGRPADDLTGWVGDYFTVLRRYGTYRSPTGHTKALWLCRCGCGIEFAAQGCQIVCGIRKSCGCLRGIKKEKKEMLIRDFARKSKARASGAGRG